MSTHAAYRVALAWPGITVYVLTIWVGAWAIVTGFVEVGAAFQAPAAAGTRLALTLTGLISILFGIVIFAHPDAGALTLALVFGLFALVYGVNLLILGSRMHRDHGANHGGSPLGA